MPTREGNYCQNVFSSWKRRNTPRFRTLLFGKEAVKTFVYKCSNSGIYESTPQPINGNKVVGAVMLLPKFLSRKKLSRKHRSIFGLKNRSCDRREIARFTPRGKTLASAVEANFDFLHRGLTPEAKTGEKCPWVGARVGSSHRN